MTEGHITLTRWSFGVGFCYMAGAVVCAALMSVAWPWGIPLAWPAVTFGLVSCGHFGCGALVYGRVVGLLPRWRRWLMAWDRWAHEVSRRLHRRRGACYSELTPSVWFGGWPDPDVARELREAGVSAVVDLSTEFDCSVLARERGVSCLYLDMLDLSVPSPRDMRLAADFISKESARGIVYVHCKAGYFRSAAIAGAWLIASGMAASAPAAIRLLERARPGLRVRSPIRDALKSFADDAGACREGSKPEFLWVRDIQRDDPELFDMLFAIQDRSYRSNRLTGGLVWSYDAFRSRSAAYVVFGRLPGRGDDGQYPSEGEAIEQGAGFILARPLPAGGPFTFVKCSIAAGSRMGLLAAARQVLQCGLPVIAAVESRLASAATRAGFKKMSARMAKLLIPLMARAFVQEPWEFVRIGPLGQVIVCHPDFCDPETGRPVEYEKWVIHSPGALRALAMPPRMLALLALVVRAA